LNRQWCGLSVDAAVDFDVDLVFARFVPLGSAFHFFHLLGAERLTAEAGMHGHDEQDIDLVEEWID
jgi:hypothetical protein